MDKKYIIAIICVVAIIGIALIAAMGGGDNTSSDSSQNTVNTDSNTDKTFTEGTYKVGTDIPAGEYKFTQTSDFGGYVERASDSSMELNSIISNEATTEKGSTVYVTIKDGEYIKITGGELVKA